MQNNRGSIALQALMSTFLGVSFVLTYVSLSRYIVAETAVEQTARKVSRCLTPTDPECAQYSATPPNVEWEWYATSTEELGTAVSKTIDYNATINEQPWVAAYTTYTVPMKRYTSNNNREYRYVKHQISATDSLDKGYKPTVIPLFPQFDRDRVEETAKDREPDYWFNRLLNFDASNFTRVVNSSASVGAETYETFRSSWVTVPRLDVTGNTACADGYSCGAAAQANSRNGESFLSTAFVAVKAFAYITSDSDAAVVRWARSPIDGARGLVLETSGGQTYELGGRDNVGLLTEGKWVNLVLRGPAGSNGGTVFHEHIAVPRGEKFRITGSIYAMNAPIKAKVMIYYYFDNYEKSVEKKRFTANCNEKLLRNGENEATCPAVTECAIPSEAMGVFHAIKIDSCPIVGKRAERASCSANVADTWESSLSAKEVELASCVSPTTEDGICGWTEVGEAAPVYSWDGTDREGRKVSCAIPVPKEVANVKPIYQRVNAGYVPPISMFDLGLPTGLSVNDDKAKIVIHQSGDPKQVAVKGYPFDGTGTPEVKLVLPKKASKGFECQVDANEPPTLGQVLRAYAELNGYKEATDSEVVFNYSATPIAETVVGEKTSCGDYNMAQNVGSCVNYTIQHGAKKLCGTSTLLGYFSEADFPQGPAICGNSSIICTRGNANVLEIVDASRNINEDIARDVVGYPEFQKYLPASKLNCEESGCVNIGVTSGNEREAGVSVSYNMPLSFPFDLLLGMKHVTLTNEKKEDWEMQVE